MDCTARLWYLTRYSFLRLMDEKEDRARLVSLPAGSALPFAPNTEQAFIVSEGHIRITRECASGELQTVEVINRGEVVGTVSGGKADYSERAEVMDGCTGYLFSRNDMEKRAAAGVLPPLDLPVRKSWRVARLEIPVAPLLFQPLEARLAGLLLSLARSRRDAEQAASAAGTLSVPLSHWQLADLAASNRQIVRITLDIWEKRGWVTGRRSVDICHELALIALSSDPSNGNTDS